LEYLEIVGAVTSGLQACVRCNWRNVRSGKSFVWRVELVEHSGELWHAQKSVVVYSAGAPTLYNTFEV